jgi:site-specific DNA recombinase
VRAVVYSRVSTDGQERDGTSLDTQERACVEHAQAAGYEVVRTIRDVCSGATLDRPGVGELRRMLGAGEADAVVAYAVGRLSRDQMKTAVLVDEVFEAGAKLEIVTEPFEDSATGRLIMSVRAFAAELEREKIAERTQRGKRERARSGRLPQATGAGLYGYRYDALMRNEGRALPRQPPSIAAFGRDGNAESDRQSPESVDRD